MSWKHIFKPIYFLFYCIFAILSISFFLIESRKNKYDNLHLPWLISGAFVLSALPISFYTILDHLINFNRPVLQRHIIRILWMVPIYAINAWLALRFFNLAIYLNTLRECYEAYVIYNFMVFILNYLRTEYPDLAYVLEQKPQIYHHPPICCLSPWPMGRIFVEKVRHGVLQYVITRPLATIAALICEKFDVYDEGNYSPKKAFLYITIINNLSQVWAMYCLILLYRCTKEELGAINPIGKFLCVKFVVFMSFWQAILISILAATGIINNVAVWKLHDVKSITIGIQNFLICIEMFIAAIAHHYSFPATPYYTDEDEKLPSLKSCWRSMWNMLDLSDVRRDVFEHVRRIGSNLRILGYSEKSYLSKEGYDTGDDIGPRSYLKEFRSNERKKDFPREDSDRTALLSSDSTTEEINPNIRGETNTNSVLL